jgi:hypothetical protein
VTHTSMRLRTADAPKQQELIEKIGELLVNRSPEVPEDGFDRVEYRMELVLAPYDNDEPADPGQPIRDLLTDIIHVCRRKNWSLVDLLAVAEDMAGIEREEWEAMEADQ